MPTINNFHVMGEPGTYMHWKHRVPPRGLQESQLAKCILPQPCVFSEACPNAHSDSELQEWKQRLQLERKSEGYVDAATFSVLDHRSLINEKLSQLDENESEQNILSELIGGYSVVADENMFIMHVDKNKDLAWMFTVTCLHTPPRQQLERVFLLNESKEFSIAYVFYSSDDNIKPLRLPDNCQVWENAHKDQNLMVIKVLLRFYSSSYGLFHQDVVFDFGGYPKLVRKMGVQVASDDFLAQSMKYNPEMYGNNELTWMQQHEIIERDGSKVDGVAHILYPLPPNIENLVFFGAFKHLDSRLFKQNYRQRMHTLLYIEEYQRRADLQSISLHLNDFRCSLETVEVDKHTVETATVVLDDYMMEHLAKLVGRSGKALIRVNAYEKDGQVVTDPLLFRVVVQTMESESFVLEIGHVLSELLRSSPIAVDVDICFCLVDIFQILHNAIENVELTLLFPDFSQPKHLPFPSLKNTDESHDLSFNQHRAMNIILNPVHAAPILLLGPFGAGKTRTIAKIIQKLISTDTVQKKHILLCTQSNSAADHYIEEYFHPLHTHSGDPPDQWETPLRINWEHRFVESVSDKVLSYCLQNSSTGTFRTATKDDLDKHSLIISTLMTTSDIHKLNLPPDYFSHIFIDEAAQAMEVEALVPLLFASSDTLILLAGDHMQMSTPLSSNVAKSLGLGKSLLERLFEFYPFDSACKLKLLENFRSYKEIVDLSSHLFYEDSLLSTKVKTDSDSYPIEFYGVDGLEMLSKHNPSYKNDIEASEILLRLVEIQLFWEGRNVTLDLQKVCVISFYPAQVRRIRKVLRGSDLGLIRVESVNNIQGLEFDILVISTVRTFSDTTLYDEQCGRDMGFLTNPKLLNTALTRARYQVVIIGDPQALCSIGECKACWKTILRYCAVNGTFNYKMEYKKFLQTLHDNRIEASPQNSPAKVDKAEISSPSPLKTPSVTLQVEEEDIPSCELAELAVVEKQVSVSESSAEILVDADPPPYEDISSASNSACNSLSVVSQQREPLMASSLLPTPLPYPFVQPMPFIGVHSPWPYMMPPMMTGIVHNRAIATISGSSPYPPMTPFPMHPLSMGYPAAAAAAAAGNYLMPPGVRNVNFVGATAGPSPAVYPQPRFVAKVYLPPCKNLLEMRQKISFVQNYCLHVVCKISTDPITIDLVRKSGNESLRKLGELSQNYELCEPSLLELGVINIEQEVEKCYLFAEDQFNMFVKAHADVVAGLYPREVALTTYEKLKKQLHNIDAFLKNEQFRCNFEHQEHQLAMQRRDLYALSFHSLLLSYEMQVCEWLVPSPRSALLNVKLDFIEKSILSAEASRDQYIHNLSLTARMASSAIKAGSDEQQLVNTATVNGLQRQVSDHAMIERNLEGLQIEDDDDPDVVEWFTKRRDDPYVQEYVTTNVRHFAARLPSPAPLYEYDSQHKDLFPSSDGN